jgi:Gas vesicle synthesis protein GvpL/GvpF
VPDELVRWAAGRAPALLARAEAEAVAELKQALVEAAIGERPQDRSARPQRTADRRSGARTKAQQSARETKPARGAKPTRAETAEDGIWAYCVTAPGEPFPEGLAGVHPSGSVERIEHDRLAAVVSRVPLSEFGEEPLRRNLNELEWLERVARRHEEVLERALERATIVPLRLCTIFQDEDGVRRMLDEQRTTLTAALERLTGRQEWGVKLLVDRPALEAAARDRTEDVDAVEEDLDERSAGGAYMLRRRLERRVREAADRLAVSVADDVHARLQDWASDAVLNPPQNRELSGHEGEMLLNGAYLVETAKVVRLGELVTELQDRYGELGATLELTGPWPPYNFVPRSVEAEGAALA